MSHVNQEQVAQFLREHPDFFNAHADLLTSLSVPNPYSGQAVSLGERQVLQLRDRSRGLEAKLRELIQFAEENDAIGEKLHKLALGLMRARSLDAALAALYLSLREDFAVPHTALRLWTEDAPPALAEFTPVSENTRRLAMELGHPLCGAEAPDEVRAWFGETGPQLRSFALAPLREANSGGLVVLASQDAQRFYPEMGTLYLTWLAELSGGALSRFLP
ncbi:MAG: DUF484 family protein [Thiobacillaceae bacterium]|jgi:hypothetical protein|nr:DUF484 family protein [Thiobacillaceae bacterium]